MAIPSKLTWENINNLWQSINQAKQTKDPQQWEEVVGGVKAALEDWRKVVNKWPDVLKKYNLVKAYAARQQGEKKQEAMDTLQKMRDMMPPNVRKAADTGEKLVPIKLRVIEELLRSLEGIRQADYAAYAGPVKRELSQWWDNQKVQQHQLQMLLRNLNDRLHGVQDEERRAAIKQRLAQVEKTMRNLVWEMEREEDVQRLESLKKRVEALDREGKSLERRLEGAKTPEGRAKLQALINQTELQLKSDDDLHKEMNQLADDAKYDALLWLVTNIAHPVKVLKSKKAPHDRPMGAPYMPPKPPEETIPGEEEFELERPPQEASECRILVKLISEEHYELAKQFWSEQFGLSRGDLVTLQHTGVLDGIKGRVRHIANDKALIDLFKNSLTVDPTVEVSLYQARPYL